jgi:hypothetical protein
MTCLKRILQTPEGCSTEYQRPGPGGQRFAVGGDVLGPGKSQAIKNPPERVLFYQNHCNVLSVAFPANGRPSLTSEALPLLQSMDPMYDVATGVYTAGLRKRV